MNCPLKQQTFHTDTTCDESECAWWQGDCAINLIAKGLKIGIRTNDGYNAEIDGAIIRDT